MQHSYGKVRAVCRAIHVKADTHTLKKKQNIFLPRIVGICDLLRVFPTALWKEITIQLLCINVLCYFIIKMLLLYMQ